MNRSELFAEVKSWLEAEKLSFVADEEDRDFCFRMQVENGLVSVHLACEETPSMLQTLCTIPVRVPKAKTNAAGLFLHSINAHLRIGAFHLDEKERLVQFRLAMPIRCESELQPQFAEAVGLALCTVAGLDGPDDRGAPSDSDEQGASEAEDHEADGGIGQGLVEHCDSLSSAIFGDTKAIGHRSARQIASARAKNGKSQILVSLIFILEPPVR